MAEASKNGITSVNDMAPGTLVLEDGRTFEGRSFGHDRSKPGEVVFATGMVGYPEALTDPSFYGQILALTFPLVGNYGVPSDAEADGMRKFFESRRIQTSGLLICDYSVQHSHWQAFRSLSAWLREFEVPGLMGIDTRALTKHLREQGSMLGKIVLGNEDVELWNPNSHRIVEDVTVSEVSEMGSGDKTVLVLDCGCKESMLTNLLSRGVKIRRVPWDHDLSTETYDGVLVSSGPGDPTVCGKSIQQIRQALRSEKPVLGICLGHQMMALAIGASTYKMKFGHRSQNQPVMDEETGQCYITSQNHGFAVDTKTLPDDWKSWFRNLNDDTNEGIRHKTKPFMSVQFHPEANPGPVDTEYIFDDFIKNVHSA